MDMRYRLQPLHTLQFYNTIANNGVMVKPTLIEKVREYNQTIDSNTTAVLNEKLLSDKTVKQLREILEGVRGKRVLLKISRPLISK
jgi:cell division protein FtsI (penicillin-binding protein 3)